MHTAEYTTPTPLLDLALDGWNLTGPITRTTSPGRDYHAVSPDGRTHLHAANHADSGPFTYRLATETPTENWTIFAPDPAPAAITAAARAALSCGHRADIGETLLAAAWRPHTTYGACGTPTAITYTAPAADTVARLIPHQHTDPDEPAHWVITHHRSTEAATADATTPAPVLAAFLLTLTHA